MFRYAIEVFAGCCAPQLREVIYPAVEEAQEILGSVQDAAVASSRLEQIHSELNFLPDAATARLQPGVAALIDDLKARVAKGEQDFRSWADRWRRLTIEHPLTGEMTIR